MVVIEANIDDMPAQFFELASQRLFDAGAVDVWMTPIHMKKGRPALLLSAMAPEDACDRVAGVFLRETTTIGVRMYTVKRKVLPRRFESLDTPYGPVRIKVSGSDRYSLEYDDLKSIAEREDLPLPDVARSLQVFVETRRNG